MAEKEVIVKIKLQIPRGQATPAPPVGPALGQHGINIMEFCTAFNNATKEKQGTIVPVVITLYADRTFDFVVKTPPAAILLKEAARLEKGSGEPNKQIVATISEDKVREIAQTKMPDLNAYTVDEAVKIVKGTARSMGILVR